jgi:hypothetical protein
MVNSVSYTITNVDWLWIFPIRFSEANEWHIKWVSRIFLLNIACEFIICPFCHWMTYARMSLYPKGLLHEKKYNPVNPYEENNQHHLLR